jgi:hypothetical protein
MFHRRGLSKPASECYTQERLRALLHDAESKAAPGWDTEFITDLSGRFKTYGMGVLLSTLQRHHLERIANQ